MNPKLTGRVLLEVCVEDAAGLTAAQAGGADRVELCSLLMVGGLTPSAGLMRLAAKSGIPTVVLIRPRAGNFVFSPEEIEVMLADIAMVREIGLAGVVLGAARPDGTLDTEVLARLCEAAGPLETCLHRVFDLVPDPFAAIDEAVDLGFSRILTSGQKSSVPAGLDLLSELVDYADGRLSILPGGGITRANVGEIVRRIGIREIHASCSLMQAAEADELVAFGFAPAGSRKTADAETVGEMRRMLALIATPAPSPDGEPDRPGREAGHANGTAAPK